ncbi:hypothetical protein SEUCBS140593_010218 [Sporothrix eucalyptigena]|uniref:Uncharacterized protein n=1 Tax=Sporothrix eucalyptigena TaxID=1812306 RepID=A0ABP0D2A4_9PEZI
MAVISDITHGGSSYGVVNTLPEGAPPLPMPLPMPLPDIDLSLDLPPILDPIENGPKCASVKSLFR